MRKATPLLLWLVMNIFATLLPLGVSMTEDFSISFNVFQRLAFCILVTFPSLYGILIVFSYYRELSKRVNNGEADDIADLDPHYEASKIWLGQVDPNIDVPPNSIPLRLTDAPVNVTRQKKRDYV